MDSYETLEINSLQQNKYTTRFFFIQSVNLALPWVKLIKQTISALSTPWNRINTIILILDYKKSNR